MKQNQKGAWGIFAAIGVFLLSKLKWVFGIIKLAKFSTAFSMLLSLGTYAVFYGWKFGVALVYLLFVHEMGHVWAAKRLKLPTSPTLFIPFVGAAVGLKEMPKNARDEAFLAYMGPVFGLLSFLPAIPLYILTGESFWALLLVLGGTINFFNLIPVSPLDGGRIVGAISTKIWGVGLVILLAYSIVTISILGFFLTLLGAGTWYGLRKRQQEADALEGQVDAFKQYADRLRQEWEQEGSVTRTVYQLESYYHDLQGKAKRGTLEAARHQVLEAIGYMLDQFRPFDYVMDEGEREEQESAVQEALRRVGDRQDRIVGEVARIRNYYKLSGKTRLVTLAIYLLLLVVLGYSAYYGQQILIEHPDLSPR